MTTSNLSMEERVRLTGKPKEWIEGWDAFNEGKDVYECPYKKKWTYRKEAAWRRGYEAAKNNSAKE